MNLKTIEQLLQNAQIILQKDKAEKKENEARGEYFNIFENLHFTRPEEHLHTPILRMLLDKNANHGVGDRFLKAFIDMVVRKLNPNFQYDVTSSNIEYKDKYIGEIKISEDGKPTGGEIDIFINDDKGHAIIIENKFDRYGNPAQEQPLERQSLRRPRKKTSRRASARTARSFSNSGMGRCSNSTRNHSRRRFNAWRCCMG